MSVHTDWWNARLAGRVVCDNTINDPRVKAPKRTFDVDQYLAALDERIALMAQIRSEDAFVTPGLKFGKRHIQVDPVQASLNEDLVPDPAKYDN